MYVCEYMLELSTLLCYSENNFYLRRYNDKQTKSLKRQFKKRKLCHCLSCTLCKVPWEPDYCDRHQESNALPSECKHVGHNC